MTTPEKRGSTISFHSDGESLTEQSERLCGEQRQRWESGDRVQTEQLLDEHPEVRDRTELLLDLVYNEILLREQERSPLTLGELAHRFPEQVSVLRHQLSVHQALGEGTHPEWAEAARPGDEAPEGYSILDELGRGGMGVVYLARHHELDRLVALKVLRSSRWASPSEHKRFEAEARALAKLHHPNIVQIYEVGQWNDEPFLALEYIEGGTLREHINGQPQESQESAELIRTLALAVQAAHDRGLIHRDLKPSNILRRKDGSPAITDFGLVKTLEEPRLATQTDGLLGTPEYMAPEQAECASERIGPRTDIYSLGVLLYELVVGRPPFQGTNLLDTLEQVRENEPVPPRRIQPSCPKELETICLKALRKDPDQRYSSSASLADDLQAFLDGRPIQARPVGFIERGWKWAKRHPALAVFGSLSGLALTAFVVTLVVGFVIVRSANRKTEDESAKVNKANTRLKTALAAKTRAEQLALDDAYVANLEFSAAEIESNHIARANRILDEKCPADRRHWEWRYLKRQCRSWSRAFAIDGGSVIRVGFPSDDRLVAVFRTKAIYKPEWRIERWDLATGQRLTPWDFPIRATSPTVHLAVGDGFRELAVGFHARRKDRRHRGDLLVWDVMTGHTSNPIRLATTTIPLGFEGGRLLGVVPRSRNRGIRFQTRDKKTGKSLEQRDHPDCLPETAYCPEKKWYACLGANRWSIRMYESETGKLVRTLAVDSLSSLLPAESRCLRSPLAFDAEGRYLACSVNSQTATEQGVAGLVWDTETAEPAVVIRGSSPATALAFHPSDANQLALGTENAGVELWDLRERKRMRLYRGHSTAVTSLAWNPTGSMLASSAGGDSVKLWNVADDPKATVTHAKTTGSPPISPCGRYFFEHLTERVAGDSPRVLLRVRETQSGKVATEVPSSGHGLGMGPFFSSDGALFATRQRQDKSYRFSLFRTTTGKLLATVPSRTGLLDLSCDRALRYVAVRSAPRLDPMTKQPIPSLAVHDIEKGREVFTSEVAFSACRSFPIGSDGQRVAVQTDDETLTVWEMPSGKVIQTIQASIPRSVPSRLVFSPDGDRLVLHSIGKPAPNFFDIYDIPSGKCLLHLPYSVSHFAFCSDDRMVRNGKHKDRDVFGMWEIDSDKLLVEFVGLSGVRASTISTDGERLVTGGADGVLRIWNLRNGDNLLNFAAHKKGIRAVAFTHDGHGLVTTDGEQTKYWDGSPLDETTP